MPIEKDYVFKRLGELLYEDMDCIVVAHNSRDSYDTVKATDEWEKELGESGSLSSLFRRLFTRRSNNTTLEKSEYSKFESVDNFKRDRYRGQIELNVGGQVKPYEVIFRKVDSERTVVIINQIVDVVSSNKLEQDKAAALQEEYLFSMMVNLAEDSCINPNTTEISASKQDYLQIKYSDWRIQISNMFMDSDRQIFMHQSSPEYVINTLEERPEYYFRAKMVNMEGRFIWVRLSFRRMKDFSRTNPVFVYTVKDIDDEMTRLLNQESIIAEIRKQNQELEDSKAQQLVFFSRMSHEIRTPINAILGMNEVILRDSKDAEALTYASQIKSSGGYLLSIVNDILDFSKIKAGKMEIVSAEYSSRRMIEEINVLVQSLLHDKDLDYVVEVDDNLPEVLYGDSLRIKQVIINLLSNAIKYTPSGSITFRISAESVEDGYTEMHVSVSDTGIGIKEEDMDNLFAVYERLDVQKNAGVEGTGLGMSIVVGLLKQMGGELKVDSIYGEGSTFSFVVKQKNVSRKCEDSNEHRVFSVLGKKLLVVDDSPVNLTVAKALLRPYQVDVNPAISGEICLEVLKNKDIDMVLLDHMMPDMDGVETLKAIRALGGRYSNIPVIALTANSGAELRNQYLQMGFTDYLEKPIVISKLEDILRLYLAEM